MNQLTRFRLANVIAYHETVAEQAKNTLEPTPPRQEEGAEAPAEGEEPVPQQAEEPRADPAYAEQQTIFDMHTEAARQLREVLDAEPITSGIDQARINPDRVIRDARIMPPSRYGRFVASGVIH